MTELVKLESQWREFDSRKVKVVVVTVEGHDEARATQADFPHLVVVSDADRKLSDAVEVIHPGSHPKGGDSAAPTTLLIDGGGTVRWVFRPANVLHRLSPDEVLAAVDREMPAE